MSGDEKIKLGEIKMVYDRCKNTDDKLRILGGGFVEKNKNTCKLEYMETTHQIKQFFEDIAPGCKDPLIEINLIIFSNIVDISYMFAGCCSLASLSLTPSKKNSRD